MKKKEKKKKELSWGLTLLFKKKKSVCEQKIKDGSERDRKQDVFQRFSHRRCSLFVSRIFDSLKNDHYLNAFRPPSIYLVQIVSLADQSLWFIFKLGNWKTANG